MEVKTADSYLTNFYFIIFSSNPTKDIVRVIVDEGTIKFLMKREKFLNLIERHLGRQMRDGVEPCLYEYGTFYMISRVESTLRKLSYKIEMEKINPAQIFKDCNKEISKFPDFYVDPKEYEKSLQNYIDDDLNKKQTKGFVKL